VNYYKRESDKHFYRQLFAKKLKTGDKNVTSSESKLAPVKQTSAFFIVVPCILITSKFHLPTNAPFIKHIKC
jgi:hypothetical protein